MNELTIGELEAQRAELLPARETLYFGGFNLDLSANLAAVEALNHSQALNVIAADSDAMSEAVQTISVDQAQ